MRGCAPGWMRISWIRAHVGMKGAASLSVPDRATLANMAPEYGATIGFFPVDDVTVAYLRATGRSDPDVQAFESYWKAQGMFGMPRPGEIDYSEVVGLDLATVRPSVAGPRRPQDRIDLPELKTRFAALLVRPVAEGGYGKPEAEIGKRFAAGDGADLGHGDVLIAAITSCTNTSNPAVLLGAGLLAKKATRRPSATGAKGCRSSCSAAKSTVPAPHATGRPRGRCCSV